MYFKRQQVGNAVFGILVFLFVVGSIFYGVWELIYEFFYITLDTSKGTAKFMTWSSVILLAVIGFSLKSSAFARMRRLHYALYLILMYPIVVISDYCMFIVAKNSNSDMNMAALIFTLAMLYIVPRIFLFTLIRRRLHDTNSSGSIGLLIFLPILDMILPFIMIFIKGTEGTNQYGENPKLKGVKPVQQVVNPAPQQTTSNDNNPNNNL